MGDGLKLSKDKRHRSSSSLAGVVIEGTRSERKLDIRVSIPEVDDQFALAESRCDDLQDKIDLVRGLKRKRKLKRRSMTRVTEQPPLPVENVPFISVRTQPKKKVSMQAARLRRLEVPPNPTRSYLDPATVEQHRMIRGYNQYRQPHVQEKTKSKHSIADLTPQLRPTKPRRLRADGGDSMVKRGTNMAANCEVACGVDDEFDLESDNEVFDVRDDDFSNMTINKKSVPMRLPIKTASNASRRKPRERPSKEVPKWSSDVGGETAKLSNWRGGNVTVHRRQHPNDRQQQHFNVASTSKQDERPVVELFNKSRPLRPAAIAGAAADEAHRPPLHRVASADISVVAREMRERNSLIRNAEQTNPMAMTLEETRKEKEAHRHPRRVRYRSRRYELPTVASQMKQSGVRYYYGTANQTNIPFIVSKSTAPSHNIGVNIQQVLNGLKIQQPLSGIPFTIAHHMGLGHIPYYSNPKNNTTVQPSLDNLEMNAIRLGPKLVRLPSYKYMSYNRLLSLYREGDGMVSRFLRAISRPHYFYTSMYNLATRDDFDGATSKGRGASQEAKQSLAEYASLYREYEQVEKCIREENHEPELEVRREELTRELAAREEQIRKVVQDYRTADADQSTTLRASASTADESYRHSAFKLNLGEPLP